MSCRKEAADLYGTVNEMEDDVMSILDFTYLLIGLTEGHEIEPVHVPGIHRMLDLILERAHSMQKRWNEAYQAARRLARP